MSIKQEEYSFYYKVKNESARKRLGFKAGFFWCTAKKQSLALSRGELAIDAAGFDEADFARPVRVHFPVENDIPPEGVFDTKFCENREPGGEDGKTLTLIPGAASAVKSDETELADGAGTPAGENGIQESHNPPANPQLTVVATLPFRHRVLAQYIGDGEYLYHVDTGQKKEIACLEMDTQNTTVQNLILAAENVEPFKKAIEHDIHKAVNAYKQVFPVDGKVPELCTTIKFFKEWFSAEHINRGLLVKEWAERLKNKPAPVKKTGPHKVIVDDVNKPERPRRSEKPTHRTINYELACGFCEELDLNNLRPAMDFAKRIIAEDREDWKQMSMTVGIIPDIKGYDRQTIIDLVRKAPKAVHNGNPDLRRTWCESFLAVHGVRDPDWYEYVPDNTPTTHEENAARLRQAGKCLRDIEAGRFQCDEEKQHPTGELADEPATPEAVEQDTTEHHPDPQPLENEPPVSQTEAGYQKIRAELHEARKNIPPKNPVDVDFGKQLAAVRGEFIEGISDPDDPKWVRDNYSASEPSADQIEPETPETDPKVSNVVPAPKPEWPTYFEYGRYEGVPNSAYHAADGISSSMLKDARISLMYFYGRYIAGTIKRETSDAFTMGSLVHSLVLEPAKFDEEYAVFPDIPAGAFTNTDSLKAFILEYNADKPESEQLKLTGKKEDLQEAIRAVKPDAIFADEYKQQWIENIGNRTVLTAEQLRLAEAMKQAVLSDSVAGYYVNHPSRSVEVSYFGMDEDTEIDVRVRPDLEITIDNERVGIDLKTISMGRVHQDMLRARLHREIIDRDYHISAAMYCDVANLDKFYWIFVNKDEGYHWVAVVEASREEIELGRLEYRKTMLALKKAYDSGVWPAPITEQYTDELNNYDQHRLEALREIA
ncbi:exonuclease VIII [Salmonella enterica subsp. enterica serovar Oslo]|uniref:RecE family exodeoxyribonuclease n=1 Tax=Salmonella enterica TaxID=28901 RepID=UPI0009ABFAEA|nr:RecE family exodeoxyribonuclease [Salmonella enterica]EAT0343969.1 exonuclease VIII [Salmonella enterica]ECS8631358.1 exonuclease VIII [Salmonella enterica subsp. enterica serovar Oslo]EED8512627.1 exonuclease VIII [Salmonella enterica subsp. enterica serovar Oslo]